MDQLIVLGLLLSSCLLGLAGTRGVLSLVFHVMTHPAVASTSTPKHDA